MTGAQYGLNGRMGMNSNTESQNKMILEHMKKIGSIDDTAARDLYGCRRLPARINDLRKSGHTIQTIMTEGENRFGRKIIYARYILMEA
jgi:hypothetical protein